ncbi:TPA: DUF3265 domain-containing protein [Vibrio parahaemolyticus]|nr:DUF3265 domain-containing protein [Vibrio parahaemolyticus]HCG8180559.1 DUF3265 domain-containing protein [Vibrio parahaemolyticus]HCH0950018.1 DUF3265 domain-containing protein [Vibrio parahaemolyticus]
MANGKWKDAQSSRRTSGNQHLTNALRRIRNAWHFYYALFLVIKVVCGNIVLRCSPLKRALALKGQIWIFTQK